MRSRNLILAGTALSALATVSPAFAQEADEGADAEIVVTATKRAESILDVPIAAVEYHVFT